MKNRPVRRCVPGCPRFGASSSPGVALIMVLGVLTVMVLMAVAFSISMRTERAASGNYADGVRARQLIYVGLARALEHIQTNMGTNLLMPGARVYPEWGVTNSYVDPALYTNTVDYLRGTASNFVPRRFWGEASAANARNPASHWISVESGIVTNFSTNQAGDVTGTNISGNLAGRVAYMIINCSGLVDANFAGGVSRAQGTNPSEIAVEYLPEIGVARRDVFLNDRASHVRYETLHDLTAVNSGLSVSSNLFIYSRFLPGYWTNDGMGGSGVTTGLHIIGMTRAELEAKEGDIKDAFREAVTTDPDEIDILYNNLLHYVSPDMGPAFNVDKPYVDLFPMINEIVVSNVVYVQLNVPEAPTNTYSVTNYVSIELWNPFVVPVDGFKLSYNATFTVAPPMPPMPATPPELVPNGDSDTPNIPLIPARSFFVTNFSFGLPGGGSFETNVVCPINFQMELDCAVKEGADNRDGFSQPLEFEFRQPGSVGSTSNIFMECLDPRFNWDATNTNQWRAAVSHTLGETNTWTATHLDNNPNFSARTNDGCTAMFVANTNLNSVGELGYLCYAPWKTIKLYGTNAHKVLDVFAQGTNEVSRGFINPNTMVDDVLAVAFAGMPVNSYPGGPASTLNMDDARTMAGRILDFHWDSGRPYINLSDVFRALTNFSGLSVNINTEVEREAFVRNAAGLLNVRQNLFTIIIEAHASKGSFIPGNPGRQRAVAIVWRDPYTGSCFLRSIKWLDD